jgi:hypothetical protein
MGLRRGELLGLVGGCGLRPGVLTLSPIVGIAHQGLGITGFISTI